MAVGCVGHGIVGPANRPTTGCPFTFFLPFSHSHSPPIMMAVAAVKWPNAPSQCIHSFTFPLRGHSSLTHSSSPPSIFPRCPFYLFFLLSVRPLPFFSAFVPGGWPWLWPIQCCCQPTLLPPSPQSTSAPALSPSSLCLYLLFVLTGQCPFPSIYFSPFPHSPTPISSQFSAPSDGRPLAKNPQSSNEAHRRPTTAFPLANGSTAIHLGLRDGPLAVCWRKAGLDLGFFRLALRLGPFTLPSPSFLSPFCLFFFFLRFCLVQPPPSFPLPIDHCPFPPSKPSIEELLVVLPSFSSDRFIFLSFFLFGPKSAGPKPA
jgi:hypothetical protein